MELIKYSACPCCGATTIAPELVAKDYTVSQQSFAVWECAHCSARFTQDVPSESYIGNYYKAENYISHTDTKKGFINSLYHLVRKKTLQQKKDLIIRATGLQHGLLLDIGAGTGAFCNHMKLAGWNVSGLEPDEQTRNRAYELYALSLENSTALFNLPEHTFDAVTMWHVLEHVHQLHENIERVKSILKPSGKAFIAVPNYTSFDARVYGEFWAAYDVPRHLYHFSPLSLKKLFRQHKLTLQAIQPMWFDSFYVSMLSEQYKNGSANHLKAFVTGLLSNTRAMVNKEKCSSLIYVVSAVS